MAAQKAAGKAGRTDGRTARRDRNRALVLDSMIDLIEEGNTAPTVAEISDRSGVSHRSVFRYFDDLDALFQESVLRAYARYAPLSVIHGYGTGPLLDRIEAVIEQRLRLYTAIAPLARAGRRRARAATAVEDALLTYMKPMRDQLHGQFAVELDALHDTAADGVLSAVELTVSFDGYEFLTRMGRTPAEISDTYRLMLRRLLCGD